MKKIISVIICFILLLFVTSCSFASKMQNSEEVYSSSVSGNCKHTFENATCIAPKTCKKCGATSGEPLGHTTESGVCLRCGLSFSTWEKRYYTDEFNNPTGSAFIGPKDTITGTFSNSATTNSKLSAYIRVDLEDCTIMLWEYGSSLVKAYATTEYEITVLKPNAEKIYLTGTMYKNGQTIHIGEYNLFTNVLCNNIGKVSIYLKENSQYGVNSTYLFTVNSNGFKELYEKL